MSVEAIGVRGARLAFDGSVGRGARTAASAGAGAALALVAWWWHLTLVERQSTNVAEVYSAVALYPSDLALALPASLGLLAWLGKLGVAASRESPAAPRSRGVRLLAIAFGLLTVGAVLSAPGAPNPAVSLGVAGHLVLLAAAWQAARRGLIEPRWLAVGLASTGLVESCLAVVQFLSQSQVVPASSLIPWLPNVPPEQAGATVLLDEDGRRVLRAYGTIPHPNILGGYLAVALTFVPLLGGGRRGAWLQLAVAIVIGVGLLATFSRAGWLAALVGLGIWVVGSGWLSWRRFALATALIVLLLATSAAGSLVRNRLSWPPANWLEEHSIYDRILFADVAWKEIVRHPILGVGAGNFEQATIRDGIQWAPAQHVHQVPLLVVTELGLFGLLALALGSAGLIVEVRAYRGRAAIAASAGLGALAVLSLTDHYLWTMPLGRILAWAPLALVATAWRADTSATDGTSHHASTAAPKRGPVGVEG